VSPRSGAVNLITKTNSMYVILDLHMSAAGTTQARSQGSMPDADHSVTFWQQVAAAYKNNGSVIFDLFNEPLMGSGTEAEQFSCWKNGSASAGNNPQLLSNTTSFTPDAYGQVYKTYLGCIAGKQVTPATSCTSVPSTGCE
jgi:aryl-phospho-beta-D-glucosidase BglC (GH1 family)